MGWIIRTLNRFLGRGMECVCQPMYELANHFRSLGWTDRKPTWRKKRNVLLCSKEARILLFRLEYQDFMTWDPYPDCLYMVVRFMFKLNTHETRRHRGMEISESWRYILEQKRGNGDHALLKAVGSPWRGSDLDCQGRTPEIFPIMFVLCDSFAKPRIVFSSWLQTPLDAINRFGAEKKSYEKLRCEHDDMLCWWMILTFI